MSLRQVSADSRSSNLLSLWLLILLGILLSLIALSACGGSKATAEPSSTPTIPPSQTSTTLPSSTPTATIIVPSPPYKAWFADDIAQLVTAQVAQAEFITTVENQSEAEISYSLDPGEEAGAWIYLAVGPFYTFLDDLPTSAIRACWASGPEDTMSFRNILVTGETKTAIDLLWGPGNENCTRLVSEEDLAEILWIENDLIAILPFEKVDPAYKVLSLDGKDPFAPDFDISEYPLTLQINYQVSSGIQITLEDAQFFTNFDPSKLTSIALTGVTALVRDTANIMENQGITYPAGDIKDILSGADITHINNEVPFAVDCPPPEPYQVSLKFCSNDRYIELLEFIGTDIVELSGDHLGDWGPEAMLHTIELYEHNSWRIYGGGRTLAEGLSPVFLTHNGNRFAFIGCNGKKIDKYATATDEDPGAAQCDFKWMIPEITRLADQGYLVIATMQHEEVDSFNSIALQQYDFRRLAEAGAIIVSGSQSHHPQAIEYNGSSFIHYGLGNLFFDQWFLSQYNPKQHLNKDKSFIDLHYFYEGNYIGTRLIALQFIDNARPRPMTIEEKIPFLNEFYRSSLWDGEWIHLYSSGYMLNRNDQ